MRVEEMFRERERWRDLANILEKRTSGPSEALPPGAERRKRLRELASLYEERLERPYEAIDTLERLLSEAAEEERAASESGHTPDKAELLGAHEALVRLYSRVGLWSKVVESLQRQAELTTDRQRARALRMEVASVYEKELGRPRTRHRGVRGDPGRDARRHRGVRGPRPAATRPTAASNLWRRSWANGAAAATGAERLELVRRRIRILEDRLNNPEAAASALRELGNEAIADDELLE